MLLLVDDDPEFLEAAERVFMPHRVLFARDADQASMLMGTVGQEVSVILVDLDLPGKDGFAFIHELRGAFPDLPVVAISGVFQDHVLEAAKIIGAAEALRKPITSEWTSVLTRLATTNAA